MMQKFKKYDLVKVDDEMPEYMSHFECGCRAIVMYSYAEEYGGGDTKSYSLYLEGRGETSWYEENQITLISSNSRDILKEWKKREKEDDALHSDLAWIVKNWLKIREGVPGASMNRLMKEIGITEPWGKHGEGVDLFINQQFTFKMLDDVLKTGDIAKVKAFISVFPKTPVSLSNTNFHKDGF